jgi:hypothetical protein
VSAFEQQIQKMRVDEPKISQGYGGRFSLDGIRGCPCQAVSHVHLVGGRFEGGNYLPVESKIRQCVDTKAYVKRQVVMKDNMALKSK